MKEKMMNKSTCLFSPLIFVVGFFVVTGSHLALLSGTLRTFQKHACDDELLTIKCPHGTTISIQLAQYGRQAPSYLLCPPKTTDDDVFESGANPENDTSCLAASSLQYYLLQTVVDACQEKKTCRVQTSPQTFGTDPCPGIRKYVEVAYKCRPSEFRSRVVCEGDTIHLKCQRASRIAIYSASFGRTHHGSLECPQHEGVPEEDCQASYATETVMRICHGRRKCSMTADAETFGNPCEEVTRKYLRTVYTCVPKRILKDRYQGGVDSEDDADEDSKEGDEELVEEPSYDPSSSPEVYDTRTRSPPKPTKESSAPKSKSEPTRSAPSHGPGPPGLTPTPPVEREPGDHASHENVGDDIDVNCTNAVSTVGKDTDRVIGFITEWIAAYNFTRANYEKLVLYLTLSFVLGLVGFLLVVVGRLVLARRREQRRAQLNISDPLPDAFGGDDLSDIDQDIADLTQGRDDPNVEVVRYTSRSTMRRQDSDTNPRAPISRTHNNYYYS